MSIGRSQFVCCTGRAVCIRRGDAVIGLPNALREAGQGGATILIASPGYWSPPGLAIAMLARCGFRVVASSGFTDIVRNNLINAGILPLCLAPEAIAKVQDTVGSDPGMVLTVDVRRGDVRARGEFLARFEIDQEPGSQPAETTRTSDSGPRGGEIRGGEIRGGEIRGGEIRGGDTMAHRLLTAQRLLGSASLPGDVRIRWRRRLLAICDAMKAPGADALRCARRLDRLLAELAGAGQDGPAQASGDR